MKIKERTGSGESRTEVRAALSAILESGEAKGRVCGPSCQAVCSVCAKTDCHCMCSPSCPMIPLALTSDPRYPIESLIAPLVFVLNRTRGFKPCWSCEGHDAPDGRLWKVPRVWFYADSMVHIRVLAEVLASFAAGGATHVPWRVTVTHTDDANPDTLFSLEPDLAGNAEADLNDLQRDTGTIADQLETALRTETQRILSVM